MGTRAAATLAPRVGDTSRLHLGQQLPGVKPRGLSAPHRQALGHRSQGLAEERLDARRGVHPATSQPGRYGAPDPASKHKSGCTA